MCPDREVKTLWSVLEAMATNGMYITTFSDFTAMPMDLLLPLILAIASPR
jgi:hypothetical protein